MNELKLNLMGYDEILKWHNPVTENEKYILEVMHQFILNNTMMDDDTAREMSILQEDLDDAEHNYETAQNEVEYLSKRIKDLENTIDNLESNLSN